MCFLGARVTTFTHRQVPTDQVYPQFASLAEVLCVASLLFIWDFCISARARLLDRGDLLGGQAMSSS
jgi:hypothetical protein